MECPLTRRDDTHQQSYIRLNPCSNGMPSDALTAMSTSGAICLNPCSNGMPSDTNSAAMRALATVS